MSVGICADVQSVDAWVHFGALILSPPTTKSLTMSRSVGVVARTIHHGAGASPAIEHVSGRATRDAVAQGRKQLANGIGASVDTSTREGVIAVAAIEAVPV
jgi:hypothetical protein